MAKERFTLEDDALLAELGIEIEDKKTSAYTPREERIIAGFEEIERFIQENNRLPEHGEEKDIFERLCAVRLEKIRISQECVELLKPLDSRKILAYENFTVQSDADNMDDDGLLCALGIDYHEESDITNLKYVKSRAEIKAAEEVAQRVACKNFEKFKAIFLDVKDDIKNNVRKIVLFGKDASIKQGDFFILGGQTVYVAEIGDTLKQNHNGQMDARLRVIYDNGTESDLLKSSLSRALYKDEAGRRITRPESPLPLFSDIKNDDDIESGIIYVLRSHLDNPYIQDNRNIIHKIGVTGGDLKKRFMNAKNDPTFLMADVEIVATYNLSNINRVKLENIIHRFFETAKLDIEIIDRFANPIIPREWFLVPLFIIDEMVNLIKDGTIVHFRYDAEKSKITPRILNS